MKLLVLTCAVCALFLSAGQVRAEDMQDAKVEQTTESPLADMALVDSKADQMMMGGNMEKNQKMQKEAQPHTIADFIIHPLIALKPRQAEDQPNVEGRQADTSSTTPSPWQLFGFNPGQGLGSSVSSLAGSVTGWLGNRIPLSGLVDTPVRESSTTTTTTIRPDVVVRVQQRQSTRKPLISINNRPNNRRKHNSNNNNNIDDSEEFDDDFDDFEDDFDNNNRDHDDDDNDNDDESSNENDDEENDESEEHEDDEEEDDEPVKQQNNNRRRRPINNNNNNNNNGNRQFNNQRRRAQDNNNQRNRNQQNRRRPQESEEVEQYDDNDDDADDDDEDDQEFYYNNNQKRSQNQQNFIQRGQQSLMNQIRQFTLGQTPAEIATTMRKPQKSGINNKKRRQQTTLIVNRNGQTIYVSPEMLQAVEQSNYNVKPSAQQYQYYQPAMTFQSSNKNKRPAVAGYPQPPLTVPYKSKGRPTQYITIPWSRLGISPPNNLVSIGDGIQSQPLILNIPQSAISAMENQRPNKRKQVLTPEAVPLLAEASLMDIFKPPRIPPARTPTGVKPTKKPTYSGTPIVIASKAKPGPQRIRPGTIVEKAPADNEQNQSSESMSDNDSESSQYILVGDDGELGVGRNAFPYYNFLPSSQFRGGRELNAEATAETQQQIPVQVITEDEPMIEAKVESNQETKIEKTMEIKAEAPVVDKVETASAFKVEDAKVESPVENKFESPVDAKVETAVVTADVINKPETVAISSNSEMET